MKITLSQINPTIGAIDENLEKIVNACAEARELGAGLVIFPEMAIVGYPPKDLLDRPEFVKNCARAVEKLVSEVKGVAVLCGHVEMSGSGDGGSLANAAIMFKDGRIIGKARKILLPTYDVFDELRYFRPGDAPVICQIDGMKLGITICEDIWNMPGLTEHSNYSRNPVDELIAAGAEIIVNLSASPYRLGRRQLRENLGRAIAVKHKVMLALVNQAGGNDDLLFDGHSFAISSEGKIIAQAKGFEEDMVTLDTESRSGDIRETADSQEQEIFKALTMGIRDYLSKCGFKKVVIGLSGGIDSSVIAVLAVEAIGPANVLCISMPSQYTASLSIEAAEKLSENLGIKLHTVPIKELFETYNKSLRPFFEGTEHDVTEENLQARIRGNILMAFSNKFGGMVLSTGNKSETAVGYCTLYGDMAGGLAAISDIPKTMVYKLARWINKDREIIPASIITRPPSAELRPGQIDQDSLPPYDILDTILEGYVENQQSASQLIDQGLDENVVRQVISMIDRNEYKRQQAAPGLKITSRAFGSGRRIPIAQKYV